MTDVLNHLENNVLYVDDEQENLNSFKLLFRRKFNIITAQSGQEGLRVLESKPIHLIITDQRMPEMTGVEFLKKVKENWPKLKCILLTGFSDNEALKDAINKVGIFWYVNKPFDPDQMDQLISRALNFYHTEKKKRSANQKLQMFLNSTSDGIITINKEQLITMLNPAVVEMFGYRKEELLGQNIELLIPKNLKSHSHLVKEFGLSHDTLQIMMLGKTIYGQAKSGILIPIEASLTKMELDGEIFFNAVIRDITQRVEAEKLLKESEEVFRSVYEDSHSGIPMIGLEGKFLRTNKRFRDMLGYSETELKNMTVSDITHPDDRKESEKKIKELISGKLSFFELEKKYIKKNGEEISCHTSASAPLGVDGKPMFLTALILDITEKKRMEAQIRKSEEQFRGVYESMEDLFTRVTNDGIVEMISPSVIKILGYSPEELIGKKAINYYVNPKDREKLVKEIEKYGFAKNFEAEIFTKDGTKKYMSLNAKKYVDKKNNPIGIESLMRDITEKKKADKALRRANELAEDAAKMARIGSWELDIKSGKLYWSAMTKEIHEVEHDYIPDLDSAINFYKEEKCKETITKAIEDSINNGTRFDVELELVTAKNRNIWVRALGRTIMKNGKAVKIFGSFQDVTSRKKAEETIEIQRERLSLATTVAGVGVWDWDIENDRLIWEDSMYELYGINRSDFTGAYEAWTSIIHPDDKESTEEEVRKALSSEKAFETQFRVIWPDNSIHYIRGIGSVILNDQQSPVRMIGTNWDITHVKLAEEKLKENAVLFRESERLASLGIWQWDMTLDTVEWSDELYRIYGLNKDEFGASFAGYLQRVHPDDRKKVEETIQESLKTKKPARFEERIIRPDGSQRNLKSWGTVILNKKGEAVKMFGTCLDITEMKEAENKIQQMNEELEGKVKQRTLELSHSNQYLKKAQLELNEALSKEKELGELKSRFVSMASHQFRTPLTVIHSNVELLEMNLNKLDSKLKNRFERSFKRINEESSRMTDLMNDVLILGKINAGPTTASRKMIDIDVIARDLTDRLNELENIRSKIHLIIVNEPRKVFLDEKQFNHILLNILGNAQKYSLDRGDVLFNICYNDSNVVLKVIDQGIGMSEEDLKNLFQPFFRGKNTESIQGTGLGMSIVYEYIKLNNGEIEMSSELNEGTTVTIKFNYTDK